MRYEIRHSIDYWFPSQTVYTRWFPWEQQTMNGLNIGYNQTQTFWVFLWVQTNLLFYLNWLLSLIELQATSHDDIIKLMSHHHVTVICMIKRVFVFFLLFMKTLCVYCFYRLPLSVAFFTHLFCLIVFDTPLLKQTFILQYNDCTHFNQAYLASDDDSITIWIYPAQIHTVYQVNSDIILTLDLQ